MPIDYEAEYNNRARVPEHPEIFARWARAGEDYRAEAMKERRAELGLSYGSSLRQFIDLFSPRPGVVAPLALFVHGGYWRSLDPSMFSHMARGLNAHGVAVAVVGYDLCPEVTIAEIIDQIRRACLFMWLRTGQRMMIYGHSAGGHLAGAMVATDWQALYPKAPPDLVPAAYSISGLFDLAPLVGLAMAQDLRLDEAEARRVSPLFWPAPKGRAFDAVVGGAESSEFLRQSRIVADSWGKAGAQTRYEAIARHEPFHRDRCAGGSTKHDGRPPHRARAGTEIGGFYGVRAEGERQMRGAEVLQKQSPQPAIRKTPGSRSGRGRGSARGCRAYLRRY
jgi:arylformamidase